MTNKYKTQIEKEMYRSIDGNIIMKKSIAHVFTITNDKF